MSTTENASPSGAAEFIAKLKERTFRRRLAPLLLQVTAGDWEAVIQIAAAEGFTFTKQELKQLAPNDFYKGEGKRPNRGWSKATE